MFYQREEFRWFYSAAIFTVMKTYSGAMKNGKAAETEKIYAAAKAFGLN